MKKIGTSLILFAVAVLLSFGVTAHAKKDDGHSLGYKADKSDACVAPTSFMRRNHFELIKHQRDITVREGVRHTDNSLAGCVDCHASKDDAGKFIPVNEEEQFCAGCHKYTGTTMSCFSCHSTVPQAEK
jgi:predicted CXXCH cytochrome family protein